MRWIFLASLLGGLAIAGPSHAQSETALGFALIVGSNQGGPGQAALRYAEDDAQRVSDVLRTLGGYATERIRRLRQPSAAELRDALAQLRDRIEPLAQSGVRTRFFFYYSGHARADALNLGQEQLPLGELRQAILALPATMSIVVLDGCQSGAFSRVKGAERAADFSWNSVERLNTEGIAVIASSSALELSQESEELRSGYFTHHWLVALRGGGDRDGDGRVTLSEAYAYAYNHTLATTAQTAVGEQHATLETNLRGKDDVPLTHPALANTRLRIPAELEARVLVQRTPSWSVLAELDKARGQPVVLALPAGSYTATLRRGELAARCALDLRAGGETTLVADQCSRLQHAPSAAKGGAPAGREGWLFELALGAGYDHAHDAYLRRLDEFGFDIGDDSESSAHLRYQLSLGRRLFDNFVLGLSLFDLQGDSFTRDAEFSQSFDFGAQVLGLFVQADVGWGPRRLVNLYARLGGGVSFASTTFDAAVPEAEIADADPAFQDTTVRTEEITQHYERPCGWASLGVKLTPLEVFGFQVEARYAIAPAIENELGETRDLGGFAVLLGIHFRTWE
ncbi:MAG TPA: caspase family protein [Polyangiales bacterium]|nr:caspase family protein [Polyangiales bacterium]